MALKVSIGRKQIKDGDILPLQLARKKPTIDFNLEKYDTSKKHTIIVVDPDAPSADNPIYKYWLHQLTINETQNVLGYVPPSPPKNSGPHRYFFFLYEQQRNIDSDKININLRKNFNLAQFVADNNLREVSSVYFVTQN